MIAADKMTNPRYQELAATEMPMRRESALSPACFRVDRVRFPQKQ